MRHADRLLQDDQLLGHRPGRRSDAAIPNRASAAVPQHPPRSSCAC